MSKTRPSVTSGIAFTAVKNACDGKRSCKFIVRQQIVGNPDPKCEESFSVKYQCGNDATHCQCAEPKSIKESR